MATAQTNKQNGKGDIPNILGTNFLKGGENAFVTMAHVQSALLQSMAKYNLETLKFLQSRVEKDIDLAKKMGACRSFPEFQETARNFCQTAFDEYSKEIGTLADLGTSLASETVDVVQKETVRKS